MNTKNTEKKINKMQWLIDKYIKNEDIKHIILNTHRNYGAIIKPTGTGKSADIFIHMLDKIIEAYKKDQRLILHLSEPIIKLCAQQIIDFLNLLEGVYVKLNINKNDIVIFNNNSAPTAKTYVDDTDEINIITKYGYNCLSFKENIDDAFINDKTYKIAIIISCHKSLYKFINKFSNKTLLNTNISTYLDESHELSVNENPETDSTKININLLAKASDQVYLLSATHKREMVEKINYFDCYENDNIKYIYEMTPAEAIEENIICSPNIDYIQTDDGRVAVKHCVAGMKNFKQSNNSIYHKVLVTCGSTEDLRNKRDKLIKMGYHVFSTCSTDGMDGQVLYENTKEKYDNIKSFTNAIQNLQDDCFILHIKQLISGIDITGLTDAIIYRSDTDNFSTYDKDIQIIGRILRLGYERGYDIANRKKKVANVLYVTSKDNDHANSDLSKFYITYYGIGTVYFSNKFRENTYLKTNKEEVEMLNFSKYSDGKSVGEFKNLLLEIEDFCKNTILKTKNGLEKIGISYEETLYKQDYNRIEDIIKKYFNTGNCYLNEFCINKNVKENIYDIFRKYNIKIQY